MRTLVENRRMLHLVGINLDEETSNWEKICDSSRLFLVGFLVGFVALLSAGYIFTIASVDLDKMKGNFYTMNGYLVAFGMYYFLLSNRMRLVGLFKDLDWIVWRSKRN